MIQALRVTNYLGESLTIDITKPSETGLIVQKVTGLGPSDASINVMNLASNDGAMYNSARLEPRNIVLNFLFAYGADVEEVRHSLYKYFPIKKKLYLDIITDHKEVQAIGYVESNEIDIFSTNTKKATDGAKAQISILCPDPFLYSPTTYETPMSGIDPIFEFPFYKDIDDDETIEFSEIRLNKSQSVYYTGDANIGVTISLHALGEIKNLVIYNTDTREKMSISDSILEELTGDHLIAMDDLIISTVKGAKSVILIREGVTYNVINALNKDANWFQLTKGDNVFSYSASYGETDAQITIYNRVIFEGV